jgi:hypothetical protein
LQVVLAGILIGGGILIGSAPLTDGSTRIGEFVVGGVAMILAAIAIIYEIIMIIILLWMKGPNHLIHLLVVSKIIYASCHN